MRGAAVGAAEQVISYRHTLVPGRLREKVGTFLAFMCRGRLNFLITVIFAQVFPMSTSTANTLRPTYGGSAFAFTGILP